MPGAITVITIAAVIVVTISQLHPSLLFTNTTTTGGDTGAHIAMPKYLEMLLRHGHLTGWDPGWYDGFPLYTFYFTLPDFFIAIGGWIIPYGVAFKMGTILGSVMLPVCAWACGRFFRLRPPLPTLLAAATLPFLFDYTFTIYGGNLFSTLAGEYSFSFSLSLAILFLGLFACAVREGRYRGWAAVVLAGCVLSHIVPGMYALGSAVILTIVELLPARWGIADSRLVLWRDDDTVRSVPRTRTVWWAASTLGIGLLLSGWWLVPFGLQHAYTTSMGYQNVEGWGQYFREADTWALVLAGLGAIAAFLVRSRFGITVTVLGIASALATALDPQGSLYNVRLLPLWFISVYLMAAWAFGTGCIAVAQWWRLARDRRGEAAARAAAWVDVPPPPPPWEETGAPGEPAVGAPQAMTAPPRPSPPWGPAAVSGALLGLLGALIVVVPPFVVQPSSLVHTGPNQVTNWSNFNYEGYENQPSYPEYRSIWQTMDAVGKRYGCGRAMWEYSDTENRFGTPESLMLLPYWTNGCIDSMEGLLFESSTTTPYHFINQAELSAAPSQPEVGLPYGPVDVALGVQHLQLLGVKYFLAETPTVEQQANADPALQLVARTGPWTYNYGGALDAHDLERLPGEGRSARDASPRRPRRPHRSQARPLELAQTVTGLVRPTGPMGRRARPGRPVLVAPDIGDRHPSAGQADRDDPRHRRVPDRLVHQLPRLAGGDTRARQGLLLPQLAGERRRRALAGDSQPDGGGAHESRRDAFLRTVGVRRSRTLRHPRRAGGPGCPVRRSSGPPVEAPDGVRQKGQNMSNMSV